VFRAAIIAISLLERGFSCRFKCNSLAGTDWRMVPTRNAWARRIANWSSSWLQFPSKVRQALRSRQQIATASSHCPSCQALASKQAIGPAQRDY
jgi:hypothetical protein